MFWPVEKLLANSFSSYDQTWTKLILSQVCSSTFVVIADFLQLWITSFDNQIAASLLTTCNRHAVNTLSQGMRTHPDIDLLVKSVANRILATVLGCIAERIYSVYFETFNSVF